jgi:hypothetical protein
MFDQLSAEIVPSLTKGRHNNNNTNNNNKAKAKCIPGGTLRVLAGKNGRECSATSSNDCFVAGLGITHPLVILKV